MPNIQSVKIYVILAEKWVKSSKCRVIFNDLLLFKNKYRLIEFILSNQKTCRITDTSSKMQLCNNTADTASGSVRCHNYAGGCKGAGSDYTYPDNCNPNTIWGLAPGSSISHAWLTDGILYSGVTIPSRAFSVRLLHVLFQAPLAVSFGFDIFIQQCFYKI